MPLTAGTQLGPYQIREPLGAGGMGEVYRATDTRLGRTVAIKVLPEALAANPGARERFAHEAQTISSLNHPHICTLHDVGEQDGIYFLVMELVEGETLHDRLLKGPLKLPAALEYASQIAASLDRAHRKSIVHRDLKPGNIMITSSGVKLLDFGLAKLLDAQGPGASALSQMPTREAGPLTAEGTIVGTPHYMAPEQIQGKDADARTDIFSLGAVLYEMITGRRAFDGPSTASAMAAILERDPEPLIALRKETPRALDRLVRVCLAKDPEERWQTARDLGRELDWIRAGNRDEEVAFERPPGRRRSSVLPWGVAAALAGLAAFFYLGARTRPPDAVVQLEVVTPLTDSPESLALSPDGTRLVFVARSEGVSQLWLRSLATGESRPLPGTDGATMPFWSPDSRSLGFFAFEQLKRLDLPAGAVRVVTAVLIPSGGSWGEHDEILFGTLGGIYTIPASGGERRRVLAPEGSPWDYRFPRWLPGGERFVFWNLAQSASDHAALYVGSTNGRVHQRLVDSDSGGIFLPSGHLAFVRGGTLYVQGFDVGRLRLRNEPVPVADIVVSFWGYAAVSASSTGTLTFRASGEPLRTELVRIDRSGRVVSKLAPTLQTPAEPELSPGGDRIAMVAVDNQGGADIWIHEEARGSSQRLTTHPRDDYWAVWSSDGNRVTFGSTRNNRPEIWSRAADRSSPAVQLVEVRAEGPLDWSPDGEFLLYRAISETAPPSYDLRVTRLGGNRAPIEFAVSRANETRGQFSPDGRWIAYQSDESGRPEIYVRPFPGPGGVLTVSTAGGVQPRWHASGGGETFELFFLSLDSVLMSVALESSPDGSSLRSRVPERLFPTRIVGGAALPSTFKQAYDVAPDGQSFVMAVTPEDATLAPISVILNWSANARR